MWHFYLNKGNMYGKMLSRSFQVKGSCKCRQAIIIHVVSCFAGKIGKTGKPGSVDISAVGVSTGKKSKEGKIAK